MSSAPLTIENSLKREYNLVRPLKYGVNPHQLPAAIMGVESSPLPFTVLNGTPGYINLLDALNAWQLVLELRRATNLAAAASFKHVSPAGAAVAVPLTDLEKEIYDVGDLHLTPAAIAYLRARQADPKCSFGDFAALSECVDEETALFLKREVSDGIIAPDYTEKALEILKQKKSGGYIILKADINFVPPPIEYREVFGVCFAQKRNDAQLTPAHFAPSAIVTSSKEAFPENIILDLLVSTIAIKYTQSNSVGFAINGQIVGVGAGQQSRVDCVKLAGGKVFNWYLRQHPKVRNLKFKADVKRQDKVNARQSYIEGEFTKEEETAFRALFDVQPEPLTQSEKSEFIKSLKGVSVSSDAFFPFRDNIDTCVKYGVSYIAQPGGSVQDKVVIAACDEYGIKMAFTNTRLFHH